MSRRVNWQHRYPLSQQQLQYHQIPQVPLHPPHHSYYYVIDSTIVLHNYSQLQLQHASAAPTANFYHQIPQVPLHPPPPHNYYVIDSTIVLHNYSHHHHHHHPRSTRDRNYIAIRGPRNVPRYHQNRRILEANRNVEQHQAASGLIRTSQLDETLLLSSYSNQEIIPTSFIPTTTDGLSESMIDRRLKIRDHVAMKNIDDICVVCQDDLYQENEKIGVVECGHEFHAECIKKWLLQKNFCPICKATALSTL